MQSDQLNRNKSIAICSSEFPPGPGGIGNHAESLAKYLVSKEYKVVVFTAERKNFPHQEYDKLSTFIIQRYPAGRNFLFKFLVSLKFIFAVRNEVKSVVLSGAMQLLLTIPIKTFTNAKSICIVHGSELGIGNWLINRLILFSLNRSNQIVTVSNFTKSKLVAFGVQKDIVVIPNGIFVDANKNTFKRKPKKDTLSLVTVGSITQRKGQHNVVKAIPLLLTLFRDVEYHIIGIPAEIDKILFIANELKVGSYLKIHGVIDNYSKNLILEKCDIFVMLSENLPNGDVEGFGIAIVEANVLGLPAIGSKNTGIEQAIVQGSTGFLIDSNSQPELAVAIMSIMDRYSFFSIEANKWALQHDWEIVGARYLSVIE